MHVLLVYAHPEPASFNGALRDAIVGEALDSGHSVDVSDLYAQGFDPVGGRGDFVRAADDARFHYQSEQTAAALSDGFAPDLAREQERLRRADLLILQFPLWWGGPPAILKGWFDRVAAYGVAYADGTRFDTGLFRGRRSLISVTTGGTARRFSDDDVHGPIEEVLRPVQRLFLGYLGFEVAPPHVAYAVARIGMAEREQAIADLRLRVRALLSTPVAAEPVPSSRDLLASLGDRDWRNPG
jgi:NAD(P)H dehydrogenase (quinone)